VAGNARYTRGLIVVFAFLAMVLWLAISQQTLVQILLYYYNGITQFLPSYVFTLVWRDRVTTRGIVAGLVTGFCLAIFFILTKQTSFYGINTGFIALTGNALATVAVSLLKRKNPAE